MTKKRLLRKHTAMRRARETMRQEFYSWGGLFREEWKWFFLIVFGVVLLILFTRPFPPKDIYLAVGQPGSNFESLGKKYIPIFAKESINLHLINTTGSVESVDYLIEKNNTVDAAFIVGGLIQKNKHPVLQSLGSIEYAPMWVFYRGPKIKDTNKPLTSFINKQVAIGPEGSTTFIILEKIFSLSGIDITERKNFLQITSHDATTKLINKEIDAAVIIDGFDSPNVQKLLQDPDIHIFDQSYTRAIVKKLPFMSAIVIPKGSIDFKQVKPSEDVNLPASTVSLIINKELHSTIQYIFLTGADIIGNEIDQFFAEPDFFPAYVDHNIPLSETADRYYDKGLPLFEDYFPLWFVSYLDRIWVFVLGGFAIIYPIFKLFPRFRRKHAELLIYDAYLDIFNIEKQAFNTHDVQTLERFIEELNAIEESFRNISIASEEINRLYGMKSVINSIRNQLNSKIIELSKFNFTNQ